MPSSRSPITIPSLASAAAILAFACAQPTTDVASDSAAEAPECKAYVAAYERCFERMGEEARAAGSQTLANLREGLQSGSASDLRDRCREGAARLSTSCH